MLKTYLNPQALFPSQQYGFSQGVATLGKTTVYISGQVGWNAIQRITDPADLGVQTRQALETGETSDYNNWQSSLRNAVDKALRRGDCWLWALGSSFILGVCMD